MSNVIHPLQISKDLVKIAIEKGEIENFRKYTILRQANIPRGEFTLDQLAGILSQDQDKSNKKKRINNLRCQLNRSIFFEHIQGDKYHFISYKKILPKHKDNANTTIFHLPLSTISSKRAFKDACIGIILLNHEYSNKTAARLCKCTEKRIQLATKRNNEAGLFIKHIRRAVEPCETFSQAKALQNELKDIGIITGNPFQYKGGQAISVNRTNRYTSGVSRRFKGKIRKRTHATQKCEQWFKPSFKGKGSRDTRLYYEARYDCKFYEFNDKIYSFNDFILSHASI